MEGLPITLNEFQLNFIKMFISTGGNWCLLGLAGSGKSTIMYVLKLYYGDEIVFFASSGVASLNMPNGIGCGTGHSSLSLPMNPSTEYDHKKIGSKCSGVFATSDLVKIIVVDEAYGYNSDNLDMIHRRITRFNKKTGKRAKRDIRLLLVGDCCQQITIADEELKVELRNRWGSHLMFKSTVWERFDFQYAVLDKVERQKDKTFKACLDVIRYYQHERFPKCLAWLNKNHKVNYPTDQLVLAATNKTVDKINDKFLARNTNPKFTFRGILSGDFSMKNLLVKQDFTACVGRRVMCINNDSPMNGSRWVNGSIGIIKEVVAGVGCEVTFDDGSEHFVEPNTWENKEKYIEKDVEQPDGTFKDEMREKLLGSFTGLPLVPANSFSISKSQGLSITSPFVIDLEGSWLYSSKKMGDFATNFAYVAISRAVSKDLITFATRVHSDHIKPCFDSLEFWEYAKSKSVI